MSFTDSVVAVPSAWSEALAPVEVTFVLDSDTEDMTTATGVRALIRRSDGEELEWTFAIAGDPVPTSTEITVTTTVDMADLFDAAGEPVAPATYDVRFLVTFPAGERALTKTWLPVQAF